MSWKKIFFLFCSEVFGLTDFYMKTNAELEARRAALQTNSDQSENPKLEDDVITMPVRFERWVVTLSWVITHVARSIRKDFGFYTVFTVCVIVCLFPRRDYPPQITPKMYLLEWSRKEKLDQPVYETVSSIR